MKLISKVIIVITLTTCAIAPAIGQEVVIDIFKEYDISGSYYVSNNGDITMFAVGEKQNSNTLYNIGSLAKSMTAVAFLKHAERNNIDLNQPVNRVFPLFRHAGITWHQILTHSSGLPTFEDLGESFNDGINIFPQINQKQLNHKPGAEFRYNSLGYYVIEQYLVFANRGKDFMSILKEEVLNPLGINDIKDQKSLSDNDNYALGGYYSGGKLNYTEPAKTYKGNIQLYASVKALNKYVQGLVNDRLGLGEYFEKMVTPYDFNYGYGWIAMDEGENRIFMHGGQSPGFSAYIRYNRTKNIYSISLTNVENANVIELAFNIEKDILGEERVKFDIPGSLTKAKDAKTVSLDYNLEGTYEATDGKQIVIGKKGEDYYFTNDEHKNAKLNIRSKKELILRVESGGFLSMFPIEVIMNSNNEVEALNWDLEKKFVRK